MENNKELEEIQEIYEQIQEFERMQEDEKSQESSKKRKDCEIMEDSMFEKISLKKIKHSDFSPDDSMIAITEFEVSHEYLQLEKKIANKANLLNK